MLFRGDPCGIICFAFTYLAVAYADYAVTFHMVWPALEESIWGPVNVVVFNALIILLVISHFRAVTSDPGMVPLPVSGIDFSDFHSGKLQVDQARADGWTVCMKCETYRPPRAHHCRICHRCIRKMDHHCPWVNNCVGEFNQKFFIQFLFYVGLSSLYAMLLTIASWLMDHSMSDDSHRIKIMHTIILAIECVLFALFVIAIGSDQACSILNDSTMIEQLKRDGARRNVSKWELCREVFGTSHPALWLCPIAVVGNHKKPATQSAPSDYTV